MTPHHTLRRDPTPRDLHHAGSSALAPPDDGPLLVVHSSCQAESLRDRYRARLDVVDAGLTRYAATPEVLAS